MRLSIASVLPLLLLIGVTDSTDNEGLSRDQNHSRRVVKLYNGTRPKPIVCAGEGFQADPEDCRVFHRCIRNGNGRYMSFRFQCGPGTIYDPESEICNHPERTKRTGCGENMAIHVPNIELPFDNDISKEVPYPISTSDPNSNRKTTKSSFSTQHTTSHRDESPLASKFPWAFGEHQTPTTLVSSSLPWQWPIKRDESTSTKTPATKRQVTESLISPTTSWMSPQKTRSTTPRINNHRTTSQAGDICTSDGFMGDSENCRKFYRCINNQRGGFIRYEYLCSEPTIWDEDKQSCNHVWAVKRRRCGRGNAIGGYEVPMNSKQVKHSMDYAYSTPSTQNQLQINYGSKVTQIQTQISNGSVIQNQTQINYGNSSPDNESKPSVLQNQTQISHGSAISQTQTQINYGDKAVQSQLQIDHSKDSSQAQSQISEQTSTTRTTHKPETSTPSNTNNVCTESGFVGDSEDCKKFYRCVDNGRGGFIRYEFSCGEGTVWDSTIEACNHAWAVKECGGKAPSNPATASSQITTQSTENSIKPVESSSVSMESSTSTQNYYSTEEATEDDNDIPYGNQPSSSAAPTKPPQQQTTVTNAPQPSNDNNCRSSGFMGDNRDCKKFYRCVDNGNGGYTRYEFSCGEGTVWDQKIEACNHPWAVENCGSASPGMTSSTQTTSTPITSQLPPHNDDYDTGYGSHNDEAPTSSTTVSSTTPQSSSTTASQASLSPESNTGNECTSSGFMGDSGDCKKFYRCVDNGNGGYTRYEFTCGEGTVWDQKIQACNHAWAVEKCGGITIEDVNKVETTTRKDTENSSPHSTSSTTQAEPDEDNDVGYGQQSSESQPVSSTASSLANQDNTNECKSSGFMGDNNDCKKFYRCVDNGSGTFTRYEFMCGEGTVWDSEIEACNHPWAVKTPCSQQGNSAQSTTNMAIVENETKPNQEYNNSTTESTSTTSSTSSSTSKPGNQCVQEGFYGDESNCRNFYRCVDNGQGGFNKYEFTCGDGTVWNQDIQTCDHESPDKNCSMHSSGSTPAKPDKENDEMTPETTTKDSSSTTISSTENSFSSQKPQSNEKCENEGFYGDPSDCKKFYRCVDDGKGGFTKYDFSCGDGTVWDQEILACNHETSDKNCTYNLGSTSTTTSASQAGVTEHGSTSSQESHTTSSTQSSISSSGNDQCKEEGFFPNSNDCKKFYRCVSNGKGGFTKYDFACGEGTVWVQEIQACDYDNDISNCSNKENLQTTQEKPSATTESMSTTQQTMQSPKPDKEDDEYPSSSKPQAGSDKCTSEGFFADKNDCTRFYRCVDNGQGGYTKYDFTCGEGTAWDTNLQTCNHINEVESCQNRDEQSNSQQPSIDEETTQSSGGTSTTKDGSTTESSQSPSTDKCEQEGFYGNTKDCTKFYRCVDNGNGGLTKYDFTCGEGTIWDQDLTTCNHPQDVANPSCSNNQTSSSSSSGSSSTEGSDNTSSSSSTESSQSTTESSNEGSTNCTQESTTKKPENQDIKCEKAGFYPDPNDCKKFYRCVDWDGDGTRFSVYHFDCGEGTIWDPQLGTCNHEDSVYPPRNCSGTQSQSESPQQTTTTEKSTTSEDINTTESATTQSSTEESTTTQQSTTSEQTTQQATTPEETTSSTQQSTSKQTTQQSTTEKTTTSSSTTTQKSTTEQTTTEQTTTEQTTTTQEETTQQPTTTPQSTTTEQTTTQQSTTAEQTATQETTTTEKSTTQQSTTSEQTTQQTTEETSTNAQTTQQSTTDGHTTQQSTTNEQTTQQTSSSEQTTQQSSNTEGTTNESATTEETTTTTKKTNEPGTTEQMTTENTTEKESSTTESSGGTTTESESTSQETTSEKECPETEDDQYLFVCPTSFRRHPKYCNMFYQCTEDDNSHEMKIATFKCPNNTIYDESKTQCVEEEKADKKCNGQIARKYRVKRLNIDYKEPIEASRQKHKCSSVGYYPFEQDECSGGFLKCQKTKSGKLRGYVHRCPEGYMYWSISKKCEREESMKHCRHSSTNDWRGRWEIPVERKNIAK